MRRNFHPPESRDVWLEDVCGRLVTAATAFSAVIEDVNQRTDVAASGELGRRRRITEVLLRRAEEAATDLSQIQRGIQNALFDCEIELRELRERDLSPADLLEQGAYLLSHYRLIRRRARVLDGILGFLPGANRDVAFALALLRRLRKGLVVTGPLGTPDWGFALAAQEEITTEIPG